MAGAPRLSIVVPTMRRREQLAQALAALERQTLARSEYELILAEDALADPHGPHPEGRAVRIVRGGVPGASAARNAGWRAARAPVVLFVDDDIRAPRDLAERHLAAHARANAVLGHVRWAPELAITPFMHWLDRGVQFDWRTIAGEGPKWWHFYTANASVARELLERVGGFDEVALPFLY
jgi:glycosyltransferase involved in cell wall biosynthesis